MSLLYFNITVPTSSMCIVPNLHNLYLYSSTLTSDPPDL